MVTQERMTVARAQHDRRRDTMASMTEAQRDAFLAVARITTLVTLYRDGSPAAVPVWLDWDGAAARFFTGRDSEKVRRIRREPRVTLLMAEPAGVPEAWVSIEGDAIVTDEDPVPVFSALARRYYSPEQAERAIAGWTAIAGRLTVVKVTPRRIRSSVG